MRDLNIDSRLKELDNFFIQGQYENYIVGFIKIQKSIYKNQFILEEDRKKILGIFDPYYEKLNTSLSLLIQKIKEMEMGEEKIKKASEIARYLSKMKNPNLVEIAEKFASPFREYRKSLKIQ